MRGIIGFDLSANWCGWAHVGPESIEAGAFLLEAPTDDLGALAANLEQHVTILLDRLQPMHLSYEAPIMRKWDSLADVRRIFGLGMALEYFALARGLPYTEVDLRRVKAVMTGDSSAEKAAVAAAAESLGVSLPATKAKGRLDAGDAVGVALEAARLLAPALADPWLAKLRGGLL
jgi:Holliday junction resolvasome RuvABC endonuclease subunit